MKGLNVIKIGGVDCYEKDGLAYLKLETVARGLGFTTTQTVNGTEYVNIRWGRVDGYLEEIGFATSGKRPEYIPENVFYRLAMKAKNETAEKFQAKVADEIIPSIRRTGGYIAGQEDLSDDELLEKAVLVAKRKIVERDKIIAQQKEKIEADKPKVIFADAVTSSNTSILTSELAKILKQNGVDIGQNRLFEWLRSNGYLIRRKGTDYNMPTQRSMELGLFSIKETAISHSDGHVTVSRTPKVTGKGQQYFIGKFLSGEKQEVGNGN